MEKMGTLQAVKLDNGITCVIINSLQYLGDAYLLTARLIDAETISEELDIYRGFTSPNEGIKFEEIEDEKTYDEVSALFTKKLNNYKGRTY